MLCRRASIPPVTQPYRLPATGLNRPLPGWDLRPQGDCTLRGASEFHGAESGSASALNAEFAEDAEIAEKNSHLVPEFRSADVLGRCAAGTESLQVEAGLAEGPGKSSLRPPRTLRTLRIKRTSNRHWRSRFNRIEPNLVPQPSRFVRYPAWRPSNASRHARLFSA
jgi:hypothetical protein